MIAGAGQGGTAFGTTPSLVPFLARDACGGCDLRNHTIDTPSTFS
ncbi:hypothetical protein RMSM_03182 [Rhodopirellula maiorica SM1]|uniref:Uncharacterized protein n=1 Tax=Rhodopirellula maiorica SM1 TaxID=1265738 RepID=M5RKQ6_9BACT|nr:hypothetical protein RMSM_03182 [Rhodopirellula maiorica SM1]